MKKKKKYSGIFFLLFISTLSHILVSTNCPRADKSPSPRLLPGLFLILWQHIPVTHSFVWFFFHLQLLPPPKSWLAQGNYSNLLHFKCIQNGILIVSFHLEQHPNLGEALESICCNNSPHLTQATQIYAESASLAYLPYT